jgi:hypothetical protein
MTWRALYISLCFPAPRDPRERSPAAAQCDACDAVIRGARQGLTLVHFPA